MNKKGFTLIEVLIVVVIIAVLAALILPRFMGQTERAVIAEAQQQLGAIRRGQLTWMDMTESSTLFNITTCGRNASCNDSQWAKIGIKAPDNTTGSYTFGCSGTTCTATRVGSDYANEKIVVDVSGTTAFNCTTGTGTKKYAAVSTTDATKGCTAA